MYKMILKVKNNEKGCAQVAEIKKGYTFTQCNYYDGTRYHNERGEEIIITVVGSDDTIEVRRLA